MEIAGREFSLVRTIIIPAAWFAGLIVAAEVMYGLLAAEVPRGTFPIFEIVAVFVCLWALPRERNASSFIFLFWLAIISLVLVGEATLVWLDLFELKGSQMVYFSKLAGGSALTCLLYIVLRKRSVLPPKGQ